MFTTVARSIDLFAFAYAFGATAWFFFVQSPVLVKRMGRDRFVPLQMSLVAPLFQSVSVVLVVMLGAALAHNAQWGTLPVLSAVLALFGAVLNAAVVIPRALRAGGKSMQEQLGADDQQSVSRFASEGGGEASAFWHRAVVLLVVVMLAGLLSHAVSLVAVQG